MYAIRRPDTAFRNDPIGKKDRTFKDEAHLAFIRKLPSPISGQYDCDAAHIRAGSAKHNKKRTGMGQKPSDCWAIPLTREEHREQHSENELEWWLLKGIDPFELAQELYAVTGDIEAGKRVIAKFRQLYARGAGHE